MTILDNEWEPVLSLTTTLSEKDRDAVQAYVEHQEREKEKLRAEVERHKGYLRGCDEYKDLLHGKIEKLTAALREIDQIVKIHPDLLIPRDYNMSEIEIARTQKAILNLGDIARAALEPAKRDERGGCDR